MSGHAVAIATGGKIFCRKQIIRKNVIPIKFSLLKNNINFDFEHLKLKKISFDIKKSESMFDMKKIDQHFDTKDNNITFDKS